MQSEAESKLTEVAVEAAVYESFGLGKGAAVEQIQHHAVARSEL